MMARWITAAEMRRDWLTTLRQIMTDDWDKQFYDYRNDRLFSNSNWSVVMLPWQVMNAVTVIESPKTDVEVLADYRGSQELLAIRNNAIAAWRPFFETLRQVGDDEFLLTHDLPDTALTNDAGPVAVLYGLNGELGANPGEKFFTINWVALSQSARWAMIGMDNDYSVLGGDGDFMDAFAANSGGLAKVQNRFLTYVEELFDVSCDNAAINAKCDSMGWPRPNFRNLEFAYVPGRGMVRLGPRAVT